MDKSTVVTEVAEAEFERFLESNAIEIQTAGMTDEDRSSFETQKSRIIRAIERGALVINENGEPVFSPTRSDSDEALTFHEPTGASLMAMDRKKKNEDVGKLYATMGDMTRTDAKTFSRMKMADLHVCMAITMLFLG